MVKKNVVLIRLSNYSSQITPPLGIGYLLGAIENIEGINPVFLDQQRDKYSDQELVKKIGSLEPLLVGIQVLSANYAKFVRLLPKIKEIWPNAKIVAGGPHISGLPEYCLKENIELDYCVKGEGEKALHMLTLGLLNNHLDSFIEDIPNLVFKKGKEIIINKNEFVNVDDYGAPAWHLLEPERYPAIQHGSLHNSTKVVPIITSRGCPYPCTFCAGFLLTGKKIRLRNVKSVVDEMEFLQNKYGFEEFIIEDENFTFYRDHVFGIVDEMKKRNIKCHLSFPNGVRMDKIDDEVIKSLKSVGAYMVTLGIESGSLKTLADMRKSWSLEQVKEKIDLLKRNDIKVLGSFILGYSTETVEDIEKTINFSLKLDLDLAYFGNYMPLPGTTDFNRLIAEKEISLDEINWESYTSYYGRIPYSPKGISKEELLKLVKKATYKFYGRPKIIYRTLKRMTSPIFIKTMFTRFSNVFLN